jgi:peptidoglycan-N-acetylglucosamine deacetylase
MADLNDPEVVFTLDLEDHGPTPSQVRTVPITREILDYLLERHVVGTFFVVGETASRDPQLIRDISLAGHEVAFHGERHVPLDQLTPVELGRACRDGRARLEDLAGKAVEGFRAPIFSLVARTEWAHEVIADAGFRYSSSVMPARNPLYGWKGAPFGPFRWPSGLIEIPCPVARFGPFHIPCLGGIYLRVAPTHIGAWLRGRIEADAVHWIYAHPYDFDPDEPRHRMEGLGRFESRMMWWRRAAMFDRVDSALRDRLPTTMQTISIRLAEQPLPKFGMSRP